MFSAQFSGQEIVKHTHTHKGKKDENGQESRLVIKEGLIKGNELKIKSEGNPQNLGHSVLILFMNMT